ncbi:hypothetical protein B296_00052154 [Ensete ventricosum]|uniref:Uncharacterized protein n=1 Tax=Ensete ventricosum TaxID=4639 RepID=A0A426YDK2_ENSVE|nr:hypothetical protein B296_00052154 [Ensete ventricosum]
MRSVEVGIHRSTVGHAHLVVDEEDSAEAVLPISSAILAVATAPRLMLPQPLPSPSTALCPYIDLLVPNVDGDHLFPTCLKLQKHDDHITFVTQLPNGEASQLVDTTAHVGPHHNLGFPSKKSWYCNG